MNLSFIILVDPRTSRVIFSDAERISIPQEMDVAKIRKVAFEKNELQKKESYPIFFTI